MSSPPFTPRCPCFFAAVSAGAPALQGGPSPLCSCCGLKSHCGFPHTRAPPGASPTPRPVGASDRLPRQQLFRWPDLLCGVHVPAASRASGQRTLISLSSAWLVSQAPRLRPHDFRLHTTRIRPAAPFLHSCCSGSESEARAPSPPRPPDPLSTEHEPLANCPPALGFAASRHPLFFIREVLVTPSRPLKLLPSARGAIRGSEI